MPLIEDITIPPDNGSLAWEQVEAQIEALRQQQVQSNPQYITVNAGTTVYPQTWVSTYSILFEPTHIVCALCRNRFPSDVGFTLNLCPECIKPVKEALNGTTD